MAEKTIKCPTGRGAKITVRVDAVIGGNDTYCLACGIRVWVPIANVPPTAFPLSAKLLRPSF